MTQKQTTAVSRALVLLLGAAVFLNYVDRGAISVAAPLMKGELKLSATEFGTAISAFFWVYVPIQLVVGWLTDRFSVYRLMAIGVVVWAGATLAMGFAGGFVSLLVLRLMLGIGESIAFPGSSKIIARHVPPEQRGTANAIVALGIALGPAVGTLAGGMIVASYGWRAMFFAFGIATLVWLVPWKRVVARLDTDPPEVHRDLPGMGYVLRRWSLWSMSVAHFASNYGFYFLLAWLPLFLVQQRGLTIREMTVYATIGYLVQAVTALAIGTLSDRLARAGHSEAVVRRSMMIGAHLVLAISIFELVRAQGATGLILWLSLAGAATGVISVNIYAVAQIYAGPRLAGRWIGFQNALGNTSGIIGPIVSGIVIDRWGYDGAFYIASAIVGFGALWWVIGIPVIKRVDQAQY
nr:MFS transporter [uncultured Sphingomonas sp.]